jgi:hypothetical protein
MIEKFYAAHIKKLLDASAINVMRPKPPKRALPKDVYDAPIDDNALDQL